MQGLILRIITFTVIKDFTLTTLAVFYNLTPFCTVLLGYFLLKEKVNCIDMASVVCGFVAVMCITYGMASTKLEQIDPKTDSKEYAKHDHLTLISFLLLIACPLLASF